MAKTLSCPPADREMRAIHETVMLLTHDRRI